MFCWVQTVTQSQSVIEPRAGGKYCLKDKVLLRAGLSSSRCGHTCWVITSSRPLLRNVPLWMKLYARNMSASCRSGWLWKPLCDNETKRWWQLIWPNCPRWGYLLHTFPFLSTWTESDVLLLCLSLSSFFFFFLHLQVSSFQTFCLFCSQHSCLKYPLVKEILDFSVCKQIYDEKMLCMTFLCGFDPYRRHRFM